MWGSIFDATKELAEKARKAAEELERNLNDSAGVTNNTTTSSASAGTEGNPSSSSLFYNRDGENEGDVLAGEDQGQNEEDAVDDSLNDAWDDDIDVQNIEDDEEQHSSQQQQEQEQEQQESPITPVDTTSILETTTTNDNVHEDQDNKPQVVEETVRTTLASNDDTMNIAEEEDGLPIEEEVDAVPSIKAATVDESVQHVLLTEQDEEGVAEVQQEQTADVIDDEKLHDDPVLISDDDNNIIESASSSNHNLQLDILPTPDTIGEDENEDRLDDLEKDTVQISEDNDTDNLNSNYDEEFLQHEQQENNNDTEVSSPSAKVTFTDMISTTQEGIGMFSSLFRGGSSVSNNPTTDRVDSVVPPHLQKEEYEHSTTDHVQEIHEQITSREEEGIVEESLDTGNEIATEMIHPNVEIQHKMDYPNQQQQPEIDLVDQNNEESPKTDQCCDDHNSEELPTAEHNSNVDTSDIPLTSGVQVIDTTSDSKNYDDNDAASIIEKILSNEETRRLLEDKYLSIANGVNPDDKRIEQLEELLHQREQQLFSKTEQITMMESMHENEKQELLNKIHSTKEEAKRRIQKAKERVDAVESKLKSMSSQQNSNVAAQEETIQNQAVMISELRKEGEKLAQKQADIELILRTSKSETRELRKQILGLEEERNSLTEQLGALEIDYKNVQNELSSARQGISLVDQLESDLRSTREINEKRATTILTLEQQVKELKATNKELESELKVTRKGAAMETEQERKRLLMEHNQLVSDLELKLQASEREAALREDALRVEIDEIRKRWQDAIRRADTLSVDIQANTAPLLRQIDSINKQSRMRATAWAELETQLRNEIENSIMGNEALTKECNEWKVKHGRLERSNKEYESEIKQLTKEVNEKNDTILRLQHQYDIAVNEMNQLKASKNDMEQLSSEIVARVRSEMTRTIVDNEERHRMQVEFIEQELQEVRTQRSALEAQLKEYQSYRRDNVSYPDHDGNGSEAPAHQKFDNGNDNRQRLRQSEGQAQILAGALGGLGGGDIEDDDEDDGDHHKVSDDGEGDNPKNNGTMNSYAALEELTSRLKASKMELSTLRTRLMESEKVRNELVLLLEESRVAREQLPVYEQRVEELTNENKSLHLEINGLKDDISDIREMYRTQLNVLIEERAALSSSLPTEVSQDTSSELVG